MGSAKLLLVIWLGLVSSLQASAQDHKATPVCPDDVLARETLAQEQKAVQACPNPIGWKPTDEELRSILSDHSRWIETWRSKDFDLGWAAENAKGRANLCRADLREAELEKAHLRGARLDEVDLSEVRLNKADLLGVKLNRANLAGAKLNEANLIWAELDEANLRWAELNETNLFGAKLNKANLAGAKLNKAYLLAAELNEADLHSAELNEANLVSAKLNKACLRGVELNKADLRLARLNQADLFGAKLENAELSGIGLEEAVYAPSSPPPDGYVAYIEGLKTAVFPEGSETGLVQLRELLQKSGLRDLEREATYAIERGRTRYATVVEGAFRRVAFDWPVAYGLYPSRALVLIIAFWLLLIPVYWWPIWCRPSRASCHSGIFRILPKNRVELHNGEPTLDEQARVERLHYRGISSLGWSAYFSLLSAFRIGFREFSVGNWIAGVQPRIFTLEPRGWVRSMSGLQSLLSLYLLAMWLLTYFGRPFQ
jgi:uncharacterized protein YjbI with pentapeptide repeats